MLLPKLYPMIPFCDTAYDKRKYYKHITYNYCFFDDPL